MSDVTPVEINEDDLTVDHLENLLSGIPKNYVFHLEDQEGNVFLIDKVNLDMSWQSVDFSLRKVTREEQEAVCDELGLDPSILD